MHDHSSSSGQRDYSRTDRITLTGVGSVGYHGVLDSEKQTGQPFFVDITMFTDFTQAAATDNVAHTVNYAEVAEVIREIVTGESLDLIETLAERIASAVLEKFPLLAVELTVHKPKAPIEVTFADVSVTIFREKHAG
ncbi:dihydroneopterin aldolase [Rothia nasimurium]|uniref:7,8-dihydroneopterin aldolase n=1 Tax=Rothia nasimurium TaxID=85336 RepID=A0A4Y9F565_9MICC|nr:dihydroneopterin aldolase [Rothia nasimurium]MBF0807671.1 dihydroneopterin aldolase [Rothia nasimurium]TFU23405.1 dihydroneopterin aldolase [Rothia nasimurium]